MYRGDEDVAVESIRASEKPKDLILMPTTTFNPVLDQQINLCRINV